MEWVDKSNGPLPVEEPPGPPASPAANLIGKKISHYRVLEVIGGGGMGIVYKAEDIKLGRKVALKFLPEELAHEPDALERFEREARSASALNHPNICTIHGIGRTRCEQPFIVMELLEGRRRCRHRDFARTISRWITRPLPLPLLFRLPTGTGSRPSARASLTAISNLPTSSSPTRGRRQDSRLRVGQRSRQTPACPMPRPDHPRRNDRGFEMGTLTKPGRDAGHHRVHVTRAGARPRNWTARSDLFSFGAVLYEMATGWMPFAGESSGEICGAILHKHPVPPSQLNLHVVPGMEAVILRALEKDLDLRYQHAADMRAELERLKRDSENERFRAAGSISARTGHSPCHRRCQCTKALLRLPFACRIAVRQRSRALRKPSTWAKESARALSICFHSFPTYE